VSRQTGNKDSVVPPCHEKAAALVERFHLTLDGESYNVPIAADETLLQAALAAGIDAPNSCTGGGAAPACRGFELAMNQ